MRCCLFTDFTIREMSFMLETDLSQLTAFLNIPYQPADQVLLDFFEARIGSNAL